MSLRDGMVCDHRTYRERIGMESGQNAMDLDIHHLTGRNVDVMRWDRMDSGHYQTGQILFGLWGGTTENP
jgi:hypothetical protein